MSFFSNFVYLKLDFEVDITKESQIIGFLTEDVKFKVPYGGKKEGKNEIEMNEFICSEEIICRSY